MLVGPLAPSVTHSYFLTYKSESETHSTWDPVVKLRSGVKWKKDSLLFFPEISERIRFPTSAEPP